MDEHVLFSRSRCRSISQRRPIGALLTLGTRTLAARKTNKSELAISIGARRDRNGSGEKSRPRLRQPAVRTADIASAFSIVIPPNFRLLLEGYSASLISPLVSGSPRMSPKLRVESVVCHATRSFVAATLATWQTFWSDICYFFFNFSLEVSLFSFYDSLVS